MNFSEIRTKGTRALHVERINVGLRVVALGVIIAVTLGLFSLYRHVRVMPYVAVKDDFSIDFPVHPSVNTIAPQSDGVGGTESSRVYDAVTKSGAGYIVYVEHYSGSSANSLSQSATEAALQSDTEQMAQIEKANVITHKYISFQGLTAVEATLAPTDKTVKTVDLLAFLKQNDLYVLLGNDMSSSTFTSFMNSFRFTK